MNERRLTALLRVEQASTRGMQHVDGKFRTGILWRERMGIAIDMKKGTDLHGVSSPGIRYHRCLARSTPWNVKRSHKGSRRVGGRHSQTKESLLTRCIINQSSIGWPLTDSFSARGQCRSLWRMMFFFSKDLPLGDHISLNSNLKHTSVGTIANQDGQSTSTGFRWTSRLS